jgi:hypothetical protein
MGLQTNDARERSTNPGDPPLIVGKVHGIEIVRSAGRGATH